MKQTIAPLFHRAPGACASALLVLLLVAAPSAAQTPVSGQPRTAGTLRMAESPGGPTTLNPYFTTSADTRMLTDLNLEGLARVGPDGSYLPLLAAEIPTQSNGDVSADGTVVTWKLKPNVTWSDGQPFTSHDVVFTYQMIMDPANPVINRSDYAVIDSVAATDDYTVTITYKQLYAPYRLAFPSILPAHVFNGQTNIAQDAFNQAPTVGTGPFTFKSWAAGDSITYDRNSNYREAGKPYLDEFILKAMADKAAEVQALQAGDVDAAWFLDPSFLPQLSAMPDVSVDPAPGPNSGVWQLFLNTSCSSGPQQGDPSCPHPVLGDLRVRQAIELAIDKQALVHSLMADHVQVAGSLLPVGPYAVDLPPSEFNPEAARQLLDQAGWVVGSDGIRSKEGVRAHLTVINGLGNRLAEETAQVIEGNLRDVGFETESREVPPSVMGGGFATQSPFSLGSFDLVVYLRTIPIDPQSFLLGQFASDQIPNPQLQVGSNFDRIQDATLDQALAAAGTTLDDAQRRAAYASAMQQVRADEAGIPLFPSLQVDARKNYVEGWGPTNVNDWVSWNIQDWWLNQ